MSGDGRTGGREEMGRDQVTTHTTHNTLYTTTGHFLQGLTPGQDYSSSPHL